MSLPNQDQAASLRAKAAPSGHHKALRCIAVASGKGGVGKTFFSVNLAICLARLGSRTLLVDCDLGLGNVDLLLGASPKFTLRDAILERRPLKEIVASSPHGVDFLAAASGERDMADLGGLRLQAFMDELLAFASSYDSVILDCGAGISHSVTSFIAAAPQTVVVMAPEPTSIMDGYALVKTVHQDMLARKLGVVINMAESESQAQALHRQITRASESFLAAPPELLGAIPRSDLVRRAVLTRTPLVIGAPDSEPALAMRRIAQRLLASGGTGEIDTKALAAGLAGMGR